MSSFIESIPVLCSLQYYKIIFKEEKKSHKVLVM